MILLITLIIFAVLVFPIKLGNHEDNYVYLDKDNMNKQKGIACIMVVVGHLTAQIGADGILAFVANIGYLAVGIFFFWSGYGLSFSLINKENYLSGFLVKRFIPVLFPFWFINIVFVMRNVIFLHYRPEPLRLLTEIIGLKLVNRHAWYIQAIVVIYLLFYICCKILKEKKNVMYAMTVLILISNVGFIFSQKDVLGQSLPFVIGMWTAFQCKNKTRLNKCRHKLLFPILILLLTFLTYTYYTIIRWHISWGEIQIINLLAMTISQCGFVVCCVWLMKNVKIKSKISEFIGHISYELYLVQQLCFDVCIYLFIYKSHALTFISSILLTVLLGWIVHKIMSCLIKKTILMSTRR